MNLPVVSVDAYRDFLAHHSDVTEEERVRQLVVLPECAEAAAALREYGALVVRDSQVSEREIQQFLHLMEEYFGHEDKREDARPELSYQVGYTPAFTERPRPIPSGFAGEAPCTPAATSPEQMQRDPKERFFWRIGTRSSGTDFPELNAEPVVPPRFADCWARVLDTWGEHLLSTVTLVAEMVALGLGLSRTAFTDMMRDGPHLLAPTGTDLGEHGDRVGAVLAGFHYDLNFLTIHGKSNFPGLHLWTAQGQRFEVVVPPGCLLVQAGLQIEWLTGGIIRRGYHEVVVSEATRRAVEKWRAQHASNSGQTPRNGPWRVSSTLFAHIASDKWLRPLTRAPADDTTTAAGAAHYQPVRAGDQVRQELRAIELAWTRA